MIDLLRQNGPNAKLKKAEIFDAAKKSLNRDINTNEYSKVSNELVHTVFFFFFPLVFFILITVYIL